MISKLYSGNAERHLGRVAACGMCLRGSAARCALTVAYLALNLGVAHLVAQTPAQGTSPTPAAVLATVHGIVKNAASGEPLARALVAIEGDAANGSLTDNDGKFEIPGVPVGPQLFQVTKPGYRDQISSGSSGKEDSNTHNVFVAAEMPDLEFRMMPTNVIRGQIQLSSGDPAESFTVMLLQHKIQDGRASWGPQSNARTDSGGNFRFAGLDDGDYVVYVQSSMESDVGIDLVEGGSEARAPRNGYEATFYPDAHDLAAAAKIHVEAGSTAQANLTLPLAPFYAVKATVALPATASERSQIFAMVNDSHGRGLPYAAMYDPATHSVQAALPDGSYSLFVTAMNVPQGSIAAPITQASLHPLTGQADFTIAGHPVSNLRLALGAPPPNPLQVSIMRRSAQPSPSLSNSSNEVSIMVSQAQNGMNDGMVTEFAEGAAAGALETNFLMPGSYWVTTAIPYGLCEASFTAGGANLAREPLVVSAGGDIAPLTLTLRDDCATLNLGLPASAGIPASGEERAYIVYVVPDFESTAMIQPVTLRPSSGGTTTLQNLTPGNYRVYTFAAPVELEYHNPAVLATLPSQSVTLAPDASSSLVVEAPAP